jgi:hypothetical protein
MPVFVMQHGANHIRPNARFFLFQRIVAQHLIRIVAAKRSL